MQKQEITARVTPIEDGSKLKGVATVMLGDQIAIHGIKIVHSDEKGLFLSMPGEKGKNGKFYESALPASKEAHAALKETVLAAYDDALKHGKQAKKEQSELNPTEVGLKVEGFRDNPYKNNILGDCQVTLNDVMVIKGIKVIATKEAGELTIAMPSKQDQYGDSISVVTPTSKEFFAQIKEVVLKGYEQHRASILGNTPLHELGKDLGYKSYNAEFTKNILGEQLNADKIPWSAKIDDTTAKIAYKKADEPKIESAVEKAKEVGKAAKEAAIEAAKDAPKPDAPTQSSKKGGR